MGLLDRLRSNDSRRQEEISRVLELAKGFALETAIAREHGVDSPYARLTSDNLQHYSLAELERTRAWLEEARATKDRRLAMSNLKAKAMKGGLSQDEQRQLESLSAELRMTAASAPTYVHEARGRIIDIAQQIAAGLLTFNDGLVQVYHIERAIPPEVRTTEATSLALADTTGLNVNVRVTYGAIRLEVSKVLARERGST